MKLTKNQRRTRIKNRIRKIVSGTEAQPRLSVFRSNKEIYAQLIDDVSGKTIVSSSSAEKEISKEKSKLRDKGAKAEKVLYKVDNEIEQKLKLVEKTAKDLGVNVKEITIYKSLKSLLSIVPDMATVFKSVQ